jgi:hypothetical protein
MIGHVETLGFTLSFFAFPCRLSEQWRPCLIGSVFIPKEKSMLTFLLKTWPLVAVNAEMGKSFIGKTLNPVHEQTTSSVLHRVF